MGKSEKQRNAYGQWLTEREVMARSQEGTRTDIARTGVIFAQPSSSSPIMILQVHIIKIWYS